MSLDRADGEVQVPGDLRVGHSLADEGEDLALALGDVVECSRGCAGVLPELGDEPARDGGREQRFAGGDDPDGGQQFERRGALDEKPARAGAQRRIDVFVQIERGEDQYVDTGGLRVGADAAGRLDAVHVRHADVHEDHIRSPQAGQEHGFGAGARLAHGEQARRGVDQDFETVAYQHLVFREQDPDGRGRVVRTVGGFLTGKFDRGGLTTEQDSRRARNGFDFVPFDEEKGFRVLDVVRTVAARHEASPAQVAIAWLLAQRAVTSVIVGARKPEQLTENIAAGDLLLTEQDLAELDEVSRSPVAYPNWIQDWFAPTRTPAGNLA